MQILVRHFAKNCTGNTIFCKKRNTKDSTANAKHSKENTKDSKNLRKI